VYFAIQVENEGKRGAVGTNYQCVDSVIKSGEQAAERKE
jgi:hypothetical protein